MRSTHRVANTVAMDYTLVGAVVAYPSDETREVGSKDARGNPILITVSTFEVCYIVQGFEVSIGTRTQEEFDHLLVEHRLRKGG